MRELREGFGWSQTKLAKVAGISQTNVGWIEQGNPKDPRKQVLRLAEALNTTAEWLLYAKGPKEIGPHIVTIEEFHREFDELPVEAQLALREVLTEALAKYRAKKKQA